MEELEILGLDVLIEPIDGPRRRSNVKHDHSLLALLRSEYGDPNVVVVLEVHLYTITDGDARRIAIDYPASDADTLFSVQLDYGQLTVLATIIPLPDAGRVETERQRHTGHSGCGGWIA
jgi:hypothetical protein